MKQIQENSELFRGWFYFCSCFTCATGFSRARRVYVPVRGAGKPVHLLRVRHAVA